MSKELFNLDYMVAMPSLSNPMFLGALVSCLITTIVLAMIWFKKRSWYFQPSLMIFVVFYIRIQLPSVLFYDWAIEHLPHPWHFFMLTQLFPLVYLAAMFPISVYRQATLTKFADRIKRQMNGPSAWPRGLLFFCMLVSFLISASILVVIPFRNTAIYALFMDPSSLSEARSLVWRGGTSSRTLLYLVGWNLLIFGPLLLFGSFYYIINHHHRWRLSVITVLGIVVSFFALALPGQRSGLTIMGVLFVAAYYCAKRRVPRKATLCACAALVLAIPGLMSLLREGRQWTFAKQIEYTDRILTHRVLIVPCYSGICYTFDAQSKGYQGAAGIRPIAFLTGDNYESTASRMGDEYFYGGHGTYLNTNAIFAYYNVMGLSAIILTVAGLLCFDLFLYFLRWPSIALLPFLIFFAIKSLQASETDLTVLLATGGYWLVPVLALFSKLSLLEPEDTTAPRVK